MRCLAVLALTWGVSAAAVADASLASPTGDVYEVEFRFRPDVLSDGEEEDPNGLAALNPTTLASGKAGFLVWGGGAWHEVQFESTTNLLESVRCDSQTSPWDGTIPKEPLQVILR